MWQRIYPWDAPRQNIKKSHATGKSFCFMKNRVGWILKQSDSFIRFDTEKYILHRIRKKATECEPNLVSRDWHVILHCDRIKQTAVVCFIQSQFRITCQSRLAKFGSHSVAFSLILWLCNFRHNAFYIDDGFNVLVAQL